MIDTDLDAALREVIFNTAAAARAEGFHVQVALGEPLPHQSTSLSMVKLRYH